MGCNVESNMSSYERAVCKSNAENHVEEQIKALPVEIYEEDEKEVIVNLRVSNDVGITYASYPSNDEFVQKAARDGTLHLLMKNKNRMGIDMFPLFLHYSNRLSPRSVINFSMPRSFVLDRSFHVIDTITMSSLAGTAVSVYAIRKFYKYFRNYGLKSFTNDLIATTKIDKFRTSNPPFWKIGKFGHLPNRNAAADAMVDLSKGKSHSLVSDKYNSTKFTKGEVKKIVKYSKSLTTTSMFNKTWLYSALALTGALLTKMDDKNDGTAIEYVTYSYSWYTASAEDKARVLTPLFKASVLADSLSMYILHYMSCEAESQEDLEKIRNKWVKMKRLGYATITDSYLWEDMSSSSSSSVNGLDKYFKRTEKLLMAIHMFWSLDKTKNKISTVMLLTSLGILDDRLIFNFMDSKNVVQKFIG
jgi:hypothetical protein